MAGQSKLANAVVCTCKEFQHPWTDKCVHASAGLLFAATPYCLRVYGMVYLSVSCGLRHIFNHDDARFAIPAGLIGSLGFACYPDVTVALYVMWKMLQVVYNLGIERKKLPKVPGFTLFLYAFCTAVLFHAGILEALNLRQSYFKFLQDISGGRLSKFDMVPLDVYGLNSSESKAEVMRRLNIVDKSPLPAFALENW